MKPLSGKVLKEPATTAQPADLVRRLAFPTTTTARPAAQPQRDRQPDCGVIDIRISRDRIWFYHGSPIHRKPLVRLFSTVRRRDKYGNFMLVAPAERGRIIVEDAPFTAVTLDVSGAGPGQVLTFGTNVDDRLVPGRDHPIRVVEDAATGEPSPYVRVRGRLEARIVRAIFYQLAELGLKRMTPLGPRLRVWSAGEFFELGRVA